MNRYQSAPPKSTGAKAPRSGGEPYPGWVVDVLSGVGVVGLVLGLLAGVGSILGGLDSSSTDSNGAANVALGAGLVVAAAIHWAFFKATALVIRYLWTIQNQLTKPSPAASPTSAASPVNAA